MSKILVLFHSNSGNTAAMAKLVAKGASHDPKAEVRLLSIDEATSQDVSWCDGIAVGCPTNLGAVSWRMKKFWDDISEELWSKIDGKVGCVFSSSGSYGGGNEITCMNLLSILINFGFLVFGVTDYSGRRFSPHYGAVCALEPRADEEIRACELLGERLAEWTRRK